MWVYGSLSVVSSAIYIVDIVWSDKPTLPWPTKMFSQPSTSASDTYVGFGVLWAVCYAVHGKQGWWSGCCQKQTSNVCSRKLAHMAIPSIQGRFSSHHLLIFWSQHVHSQYRIDLSWALVFIASKLDKSTTIKVMKSRQLQNEDLWILSVQHNDSFICVLEHLQR